MEEGVELTSEMSLVGEEISYNSDTTEMNGYIAYNETDTSQRPGILVVHEWWGHNDYVRERADMLAELGFVALAVDMYGEGKQARHPSDAKKFSGMVMQNMDMAEKRFTEAMDLLRDHPLTDSNKISAVGYCFGGSLILALANKGVDLDAVAAFHSGVQLPVSPSEELEAKVLVQNGAEDPFVSQLSVSRFKTEMDSLGKTFEYIAYPEAVHAYTNPGADSLGRKYDLPLAYNQDADIKSWEKMKSFFEEIYPEMNLE
jgi:dienelactone hydrolase